MADIKNIDDLRRNAIETLSKLERNKIDIAQAGVTAKLYENIISSLKTEMEYHKMLDQKPNIPFLQNASTVRVINGKENQPLLLDVKKSSKK